MFVWRTRRWWTWLRRVLDEPSILALSQTRSLEQVMNEVDDFIRRKATEISTRLCAFRTGL